jgi:RNA polymerase sigma factor (sigma-70 family)
MEASALPRLPARRQRKGLRHSLLADDRLARLVASGDEQAFATLYERYHQPLYRYCRSMLRHDADAQDAMQSALMSAFAALSRSQRDAPVRPWLFRIAHNEAISLLRRRRPEVELAEDNGGAAASAEEQSARREQLSLLVEDLRELPERQRAALVMRELSGLSHEDIGVVLETSLGAAKQTIFEARRALQEFVEGRAMSCDEVCRLISDDDGRVMRGRRVRAHLRDCVSCSAFATAIPARTANLRALAPPLPAVAGAGLLAHVLGGASKVGGGSYAGGGSAAGVAGALSGKTALLGVAMKALASLAVVSAATIAVTRAVEHRSAPGSHSRATPAAHRTGSSAAAAPAASGSLLRARSNKVIGLHPTRHVTVGQSAGNSSSKSHGLAVRSGSPAAGGVGSGNGTIRSATHGSSTTAPGAAVKSTTSHGPGRALGRAQQTGSTPSASTTTIYGNGRAQALSNSSAQSTHGNGLGQILRLLVQAK